MNDILVIALAVLFFILSLFIRKVRDWRGLPYACGALAVFFLVNALINREQLFPSLLFMVIALGFGLKSIFRDRSHRVPER